ncbi:hypothetical protein QTG54_004513 [Skeletonema marinoi]|uniref:Replication factor A protein 3 n=1 Tax=Skeletonema marinoi TaxID=267567 RepID=A0AAD8YH55_9STRA|nr:hypothetical protein QTG54_004513 [Skeletonema marinoi]|mmetsp:Transcript_27115/g.41734  ORF Transcript_27115/g.41734 Transcript_27115/m.41734 type:complete len:115 (+) Transcript_27115:66-410(+)|eukprot:CAMPEP_0113372746 /NCGR_PEP_ID=MMETSP0013_2-20120614/697_1 /TAXON_ID=2843 ORGANISM="Skeletonema costatum, Strain 1716" /NCGR_SAMPLE_ID=MMETSP0013_2 /ASSEMBLY_ACC=CAM_ASM_000158 /LENGTH=114 /DNA_ID=CAMNT_0000254655 /DNA_START=22 /DNA_END=366 /DNA_ORIENTATION=+ /assembly_acc=CAM_ASM_000158
MDGAFERLNHATLQTAPVDAQVISLVGKAINFDGVDTATIEAADGGQVQVVQVDVTTFNYAPNMICEIMGSPLGNNTVQYFLCRDLGEDFDLENYNKLIQNVMKNPKYADIFYS